MSHSPDAREANMVGRRTDGTPIRRPISPHLQVYDMAQMTSATSIASRITGVIWTVGLLILVWWLLAAAAGPRAFGVVSWFLSSWLGILGLFGLSAAAWYHTLNGVRHLAYDAGYGFDLPTTYKTGRAVLIGTALATILTWIIAVISWA
jgi:succinate dehydrogenase / fumarate reductase cytochrome b subunit